MRTPPFALALLLFGIPLVASAQIYKCVDKHGRVTYSQTKPAAGACEGMQPAAPAPSTGDSEASEDSGDGTSSLMKFSEEIDKSREQENKERQKAEQLQARRDARCKNARSRLALLEQSSRVFYMDEKGERHYRSDAERDQEIQAARQSVSRECG